MERILGLRGVGKIGWARCIAALAGDTSLGRCEVVDCIGDTEYVVDEDIRTKFHPSHSPPPPHTSTPAHLGSQLIL